MKGTPLLADADVGAFRAMRMCGAMVAAMNMDVDPMQVFDVDNGALKFEGEHVAHHSVMTAAVCLVDLLVRQRGEVTGRTLPQELSVLMSRLRELQHDRQRLDRG